MRSLKRAAAVLVLGPVAACGGGDPLAPTPPDIGGAWTFTERWRNEGLRIACVNAGTIDIEQAGTVLRGSLSQEGTCTDGSGATFDTSAEGDLRVGRVSGETASFSAANCDYAGTISGTPPDALAGSVACSLSAGGTTVVYRGTWEAMK